MQGKSTLTAIFCCVRAILYPGSKIVVASGTKGQARQIVELIEDLRKEHPNLEREISFLTTNANDSKVEFHNGSWIKVVASTENARSKRANILVIDEFRMVDLDVIQKVLRKFLTAPRQPGYLNKEEYKHLKERNKEIYLSSAYYKSHWSWERVKTYFSAMLEGKKYFICAFPYQLSIAENLLMKEAVLDEMAESDFDEISWSIEMECLFFGESENAYFRFEDLDRIRKISIPLYPKQYYSLLKDSKFKYPDKKDGEIRLLSCDIASVGGDSNDSSVFSFIRLLPRSGGYERQVSYMESFNGVHTVDQSIRIRQLFEDLDCDYIVLDTRNVGEAIYDNLATDLYDKERNIEYPAISCINDEDMAVRCAVRDAQKVIYSIKATQTMNSDIAIMFKDHARRGKLKLLINENEGSQVLKKMKGYEQLTAEEKSILLMQYIQSTFLINETINLSNEGKDGLVKLVEPSGKRKDRYSSVSYGNYIASQLEKEHFHKRSSGKVDINKMFRFHKPKTRKKR